MHFALPGTIAEIVEALCSDRYLQIHPRNIRICGDVSEEAELKPRYNISKKLDAPVIYMREGDGGASEKEHMAVAMMSYGLVPSWNFSVESSDSNRIATVVGNELANGAWSWKELRRKRCLVPCHGYVYYFFPLKKEKNQVPSFIKRKDGDVLFMAGLYSVCKGTSTFAVVKREAPETTLPGTTQPIFLKSKDEIDCWLQDVGPEVTNWDDVLSELVIEEHDDKAVPLTHYKVPNTVRDTTKEAPSLIQPVSEQRGSIKAFFAKQRQTQVSTQAAEPDPSPSQTLPLTAPRSYASPSRRRRVPSKPVVVTQINRRSISPEYVSSGSDNES
ncbi:hypothetical protein DFP72DRAFT_817328 [Ephemerocybe angulata]|uniref:DUF159-domain-containing protein n=1 Tax=Ephemerocybe angulata TaxID=980116 RepID=A0A8H6HQJ6_9AGAR|nr:hypothetical protein DFP72DRAFT_817328 [Tulosesus angulatus]